MIYDVGIIGSGVAGTFAAYKIAQEYPNVKCIVFEGGRPPGKRRLQMTGFLGLLPNSDGKLYINDIDNLRKISKNKKTDLNYKWFLNTTRNVLPFKIIKDNELYRSITKKIKKEQFKIRKNNYVQLYPSNIHHLSKYVADVIHNAPNMITSFDNEVISITKHKKNFVIISEYKEVECKKIIMCAGRVGWRWTNSIYQDLQVASDAKLVKFGIRVELPELYLKEFNKSNCMLTNEELEVGPFCWGGTVVPEDHSDMVLSSFRSNEQRWKSEKVSFNLFGCRSFEEKAFEQIDRIGQLTFILTNERVMREKLSSIISNKSKLSILPEYNWLGMAIEKIKKFIPDLLEGYFYSPTLLPVVPQIKLSTKFETQCDNLYCAGEAAGHPGILFAAISGLIAADAACE